MVEMAQDGQRTPSTPGPGYLGSTSFSAVYSDHGSMKDLYPVHSTPNGRSEERRHRLFVANRESQIRKGAACLALIADLPSYELAVKKWQEAAEISMIRPWTMACFFSLKSALYDHLAIATTSEQKEKLLLDCSAQIFENSLQTLDLNQDTTIDGFACQMTSQRLRWEAVGIYFTSIGLAIMTNDSLGFARSKSLSHMQWVLAKQMLEASDLCISFWCRNRSGDRSRHLAHC